MTIAKEKRQSPRVQLQAPFRYRIISPDAAGFQDAAFQDISQSGFKFHSQEFIPKQASIMLELNLLGYAPIRSLARAVWIRQRPSDNGFEVGGMFVELPQSSRSAINQLVPG